MYMSSQRGFTLIELVIVVVLLGILSAYAISYSTSPAELTLTSQAQKMASDIKHVQTLAHTSGKAVRLTITPGANGVYAAYNALSCSTGCTEQVFSAQLEKDVVLGGTASIDFNTLGQPLPTGATSPVATFTLTAAAGSSSILYVDVSAETGFVTIR